MGSSYVGGWATGLEARPCPRSSPSEGIVGIQPEPGGGSLHRAGGTRREAWGIGDTELARLRTDVPSKRHSGRKGKCFWKAANTQILNEAGGESGRWEAADSLAGKMLWAPGGLSLDPTPALQRRGPQRGPGRAGGCQATGAVCRPGQGGGSAAGRGPSGPAAGPRGTHPGWSEPQLQSCPRQCSRVATGMGATVQGRRLGPLRFQGRRACREPAQELQGVGTRGRGDSQA